MHWLVCFDVQDDRTRTRISRYLETVGRRVQGSVFEVVLRKESHKNRLVKALRKIISECDEAGRCRCTILSHECSNHCHESYLRKYACDAVS